LEETRSVTPLLCWADAVTDNRAIDRDVATRRGGFMEVLLLG
jgi:hypothetical protein